MCTCSDEPAWKPGAKAEDPAVTSARKAIGAGDYAGAQQLLNILWLNTGLDAGYAAVGVTLALTAWRWGALVSDLQSAGRPRPALDLQIAATAAQHGLVLVTRNTADFAGLGLEIVDPWSG